MAENVLGLVLLLIYQIIYLKYSKISTEKRIYCVNVTKRCRSEIKKPPSISSRTPARLKLILYGRKFSWGANFGYFRD